MDAAFIIVVHRPASLTGQDAPLLMIPWRTLLLQGPTLSRSLVLDEAGPALHTTSSHEKFVIYSWVATVTIGPSGVLVFV